MIHQRLHTSSTHPPIKKIHNLNIACLIGSFLLQLCTTSHSDRSHLYICSAFSERRWGKEDQIYREGSFVNKSICRWGQKWSFPRKVSHSEVAQNTVGVIRGESSPSERKTIDRTSALSFNQNRLFENCCLVSELVWRMNRFKIRFGFWFFRGSRSILWLLLKPIFLITYQI